MQGLIPRETLTLRLYVDISSLLSLPDVVLASPRVFVLETQRRLSFERYSTVGCSVKVLRTEQEVFTKALTARGAG